MKRTTAWILSASIALFSTFLLLPASHAKRSTNSVRARFSSLATVPAQPTISIDDVSLAEGDNGYTAFSFTVTLSDFNSDVVTVQYQTANGTAFAPEDYLPESNIVIFSPNDIAEIVTVLVRGDELFAPNETFFVNLSNPVGATIADAQGLGTILNDDAAGTSEQLPPNAFAVNTSNQLLSFNVAQPGVVLSRTPITGLANGEIVLGIDFRPANGQLYAFTNYSRLRTINTTTGVATLVAIVNSGLAGSEYNIDFDPVADRLRIVNDTGQNHLVNPDTGAAIVQDPINAFGGEGGKPRVVGIAYSNNFTGASSTTLYDIESNFDGLFTQNPPTGTLSYVGSLGVSVSPTLVGFDIAPVTNIGYASLTSSNVSSLYVVDLDTGFANLVGQIGSETNTLRDITISTIPPPQMIGLKPSNRLVTFNSLTPGTVSAPLQITGLAHGEQVIGIDFRPANGGLYGFTTFNRVVSINTTTGAATRVILSNGLIGNSYGVDFNPVVDRMRLVNDTDQNARVNADTGASIIDSMLAYAAGDRNAGKDPSVSGVAYTNNFAGATSTTLYGIDSAQDVLVIQNPPNNGTLTTVGSLGVNISPLIGFDIANRTGAAYASLRLTNGGLTRLYAINLVNGTATLIGTIAGPEPVNGLAIVP